MSEEKIAYSISQKKLSLKTIVENCTYDVYQYLSNVKKLLTTSDTVISFFNFNSLLLENLSQYLENCTSSECPGGTTKHDDS